MRSRRLSPDPLTARSLLNRLVREVSRPGEQVRVVDGCLRETTW